MNQEAERSSPKRTSHSPISALDLFVRPDVPRERVGLRYQARAVRGVGASEADILAGGEGAEVPTVASPVEGPLKMKAVSIGYKGWLDNEMPKDS